MSTASRSPVSARTSTRSWPLSLRSGGCGRIPSCCSSCRRSPSRPARSRSTGSHASTSTLEWPAAALAVAYLAYPPVQWLTMSDFHPVALACPLLLYAWWHLDERRLWAFALLAAAAIATKEHVGLAVAAMGLWYARSLSRPRTGAAIVLLAGAAALVATLVVVPHFAPAGSSAFESRYDSPSLDGRDLTLPRLAALPARVPATRRASRVAGRRARARAQPALLDAHPDLREDALRGRGRAGAPRRCGLRRRAGGLAARVLRRADGDRRDAPARPARPRGPRSRQA